jgi:hypothetical protein
MPAFQDYDAGKVELESGVFSIDVEKDLINVKVDNGKSVSVGTHFAYLVV